MWHVTCDEYISMEVRNRGGGGCNVGWRGQHLSLEMVRVKSSLVDVIVSTSTGTNIDDFGGGRVDGVDICVGGTIDVLNSYPSRVVKEASRCNKRGSTYRVASTNNGSKKTVDTNRGSKEVENCTNIGLE